MLSVLFFPPHTLTHKFAGNQSGSFQFIFFFYHLTTDLNLILRVYVTDFTSFCVFHFYSVGGTVISSERVLNLLNKTRKEADQAEKISCHPHNRD